MTRFSTLLVLCSVLAACGDEPPRHSERPSRPSRPATLELRHRFEPGTNLVFETKTVERAAQEVTIEMRYRWRVAKVRPSGEGEIHVTIERYKQRSFPILNLPRDAVRLNEKLTSATFRMLVSPDGRQVKHLGHEGLPEISEYSIEALRSTLRGHVLRLPDKAIRSGQRWTVETTPPEDAGPGGVTSRSNWRVLSIRPRGNEKLIELVCLSTMEPGPLKSGGKVVRNHTEFHYSYLWNATKGLLEGVSSTGTTVTTSTPQADGGGRPTRDTVRFEATVRLVRERPRL